jgi:hypothetical protein
MRPSVIAYVEAMWLNFGGFLKVVNQKYEGLLLHGCRALSEE